MWPWVDSSFFGDKLWIRGDSLPYLIGICGGSAAGKSLFAKELQVLLDPKPTILSLDSYYKDIGPLNLEERSKTNFDHPETMDIDLLDLDGMATRLGVPEN